MLHLGSLPLPWSRKYSPKLAPETVALKLQGVSELRGGPVRGQVAAPSSPPGLDLLTQQVRGEAGECESLAGSLVFLTLLVWGWHFKSHWSRSFVVLPFMLICLIHQKLWNEDQFSFLSYGIQVSSIEKSVFSPWLCKPSCPDARGPGSGLFSLCHWSVCLPWASTTLSSFLYSCHKSWYMLEQPPIFPFSSV